MASTNTTTQEYEILTSFLLSRASLQDIITLNMFTGLFPRDRRGNPQVKLLYRELQLLQSKTCERVKKNIQLEVRLGAKQRRNTKKEQREGKGVEDDAMTGIELFGAVPTEPRLPLKQLLQTMAATADDLDTEFQDLDKECETILEELKMTVGDLSDLRYGKFSNVGIDGKVISDLENLHDTCERVLNSEPSS